MVRTSNYWPDIYFGAPGALTKLPWPRGGFDKPYEKQVADFLTGTGQHIIQSQAQGSRLITLNWNAMHADNYALVEQYWTGMMGYGPWALVDPSTNNMLMPNQASATNNLYDTTGFYTSTGASGEGTLLSNSSATYLRRTGSTRSLQWQFPVAAITTPILFSKPPYRNWYGYPVAQGKSYTWSFWMTPDGVVDTSISGSARIRWVDASGGFISEAASSTTAVTTWQQLSATGIPPSNAVYAQPVVVLTGSTITVNASVYIDSPLFEIDSVVNSWAPGTGMRAVEILSLTDTPAFDAKWRASITMVLRELVQ
jgi:hypothetical protein